MTRGRLKTVHGKHYTFRGGKFIIPARELVTAMREARRLHQRLMGALMEEVERHKRLVTREGRREASISRQV